MAVPSQFTVADLTCRSTATLVEGPDDRQWDFQHGLLGGDCRAAQPTGRGASSDSWGRFAMPDNA